MLTIRKAQLEALQAAGLTRFKQRVVVHIRQSFADLANPYPDDQLLALVDSAIVKGADYELNTEQVITALTDVMFLYGETFDTNLDLPWAAEILYHSQDVPQSDTANHLYDAAIQHLEAQSSANQTGEL